MLPNGPTMQFESGSFHEVKETESRLVSRQGFRTRPNLVFPVLFLPEVAISTAISQTCKLSLKSTSAATMPGLMPLVPDLRDCQPSRTNANDMLARIQMITPEPSGM
jgi:hypothetical protein